MGRSLHRSNGPSTHRRLCRVCCHWMLLHLRCGDRRRPLVLGGQQLRPAGHQQHCPAEQPGAREPGDRWGGRAELCKRGSIRSYFGGKKLGSGRPVSQFIRDCSFTGSGFIRGAFEFTAITWRSYLFRTDAAHSSLPRLLGEVIYFGGIREACVADNDGTVASQ